jgi:hypothetical protein
MKKFYIKAIISVVLILVVILSLFVYKYKKLNEVSGDNNFQLNGKKIVLPSPLHGFYYLNSLGFPWKGLGYLTEEIDYRIESQIAIQLGIKASNGILYLNEKDLENSYKAREQVLKLAEKLEIEAGLRLAILELDLAYFNGNESDQIQESLNNLENTLEVELKNKGRDDLSLLIELGSWVEGLRVATLGISKNYKLAYIEVLKQPHISALSIQIINSMIDNTKKEDDSKFLKRFLFHLEGIHAIISKLNSKTVTIDEINSLRKKSEEIREFLDQPY